MTVSKTKSLLLMMITMVVSATASANPVEGKGVAHTGKKDVFVYTAERSMRGAELLVFGYNGDMLMNERMRRRKLVIDFAEVRNGTYTIMVVKNGTTKTFQYEKR